MRKLLPLLASFILGCHDKAGEAVPPSPAPAPAAPVTQAAVDAGMPPAPQPPSTADSTAAVDFDKVLPVQIGDDWATAKQKLFALDPKCEALVFAGVERVSCPIKLDLGFFKTEGLAAETRAGLRVVAIQVGGSLQGDCDSFMLGLARTLKTPWRMGKTKPEGQGMVKAEGLRVLGEANAPQVDMMLRANCGPPSLVSPSIRWEDAWLIADTDQKDVLGGPLVVGWALNKFMNDSISAGLILRNTRAQNSALSRVVAQKARVALTSAQQNSPRLSARSSAELRRYVETALAPGWIEKEYDAAWVRKRDEEKAAAR